MCYLKSYIPQLVIMSQSKLIPFSFIHFDLLSLIKIMLVQEKIGVAESE